MSSFNVEKSKLQINDVPPGRLSAGRDDPSSSGVCGRHNNRRFATAYGGHKELQRSGGNMLFLLSASCSAALEWPGAGVGEGRSPATMHLPVDDC